MPMLRDDEGTQTTDEVVAERGETATQSSSKTQEFPETKDRDDEEPRVLEEVVIEEVSIDGMCGVY